MLFINKKYSGKEIKSRCINNVVNVMGKEVRIPLTKINDHGVYSFTMKDNSVTLQHHNNSWSCQKEEYEKILSDGQKLLNEMFGDVLEQTKNIK